MGLKQQKEMYQLLNKHNFSKKWLNYEVVYLREAIAFDIYLEFVNSNRIMISVYELSWAGYNPLVEVIHSITSIEQLEVQLQRLAKYYP